MRPVAIKVLPRVREVLLVPFRATRDTSRWGPLTAMRVLNAKMMPEVLAICGVIEEVLASL